jgi:PAS domain-containing protein
LGYEPETWNLAFEFVHPDDIAKAESLMTLALDSPSVNVAAEFRLRHAEGQIRDFEVIANNLLSESGVAGILATYRDITERKQAEVALQQQTERERLVTQIAQRIRQSLNLEEILQTTVAEVRQFLQTERVFIYRFEPDWSGVVVVESVLLGWSPLLGMKVKDSFFAETSNRELYTQGRVQATEDIYTAGLSQCHINFLAQLQVRANLVVPILQEQQLWGLLVANHRSEPRHWQQLRLIY